MKSNCKLCGKITKNPKFCSRSCSATYNNRRRILSEKHKNNISKNTKGRRRGFAKLFFKGYENRKCTVCDEKFIIKVTNKRQTCGNKKCVSELIHRKIVGRCGGYRKNSVRGKSFHYKKKDGEIVFLQSTYELKVAQELDKNNIEWIRPSPLPWIDNKNKKHLYYPDFYLMNFNVYLDPKNPIIIEKDKDKIRLCSSQNHIIILVLKGNELTWNIIKGKI